MSGYLWLDGALVEEAHARVSPVDHGLLVGDGVFETLRIYDGEPFAWTRHYERLCHSAAGLDLAVPDATALRAATDEVLTANAVRTGRLRITVTGGPAPLGSERGDATPTVIVATSALGPGRSRETVVTVPWRRNERGATTGLKTTSYAENVRALAFARAHGATEAIFANTRDELCEATGSNVFVVVDGMAETPPAEAGCLLGVTRALVLELCAREGIRARETPLLLGVLADADEVFLTSTTREVQPVGRADERVITPAPGPVTARIAAAFRALVAADIDP